MDWIVSSDKEIAGNSDELEARKAYISRVTGAKASNWESFPIAKSQPSKFLLCTSSEGIDGAIITAHINDVIRLSTLNRIAQKPLLVANSCMVASEIGERLFSFLQRVNPDIELRFANQKLQAPMRNPLLSVELTDVGTFGFKTSSSERDLFRYCFQEGFLPALKKAFSYVVLVHPFEREEKQVL